MTQATDNAALFSSRPRERYAAEVAAVIAANCAYLAATRGGDADARAAVCVARLLAVATSHVATNAHQGGGHG